MESVLVIGGHGFLGRYLVNNLKGKYNIYVPPKKEFNLKSSPELLWSKIKLYKPDHIINLAGKNGGLKYNQAYPLEIFRYNTIINSNFFCAVENYLQKDNIKSVLCPITSCAYPDIEDMSEENFWNGPVHHSVECHGLAKRTVEAQSRMLAKMFLDTIFMTPCLNNLYGPGDNFDSERSKFVAALVAKICYKSLCSTESAIQMIGSGLAKRQPYYVEDAALHIAELIERPYPGILNLGNKEEFTIREVANTIVRDVGWSGELVWESNSIQDGQMSKKLNLMKMQKHGLECRFDFKTGIEKTIKFYLSRMIN